MEESQEEWGSAEKGEMIFEPAALTSEGDAASAKSCLRSRHSSRRPSVSILFFSCLYAILIHVYTLIVYSSYLYYFLDFSRVRI